MEKKRPRRKVNPDLLAHFEAAKAALLNMPNLAEAVRSHAEGVARVEAAALEAHRQFEKIGRDGLSWLDASPFNPERVARIVAEYQRNFERAVAGDNEALLWLFKDSGIAMLEDEPIRKRIDELRYDENPDRKVLDRIASAIRRSLVAPAKPGRPSRTPVAMVRLVPVIQKAFDTSPVRLKRAYRNVLARDLDRRAIAKHVAASVPAEHREAVRSAVVDVLETKPGVTKGFGIDVVAKALSRSSGWIRSTRKRKQL